MVLRTSSFITVTTLAAIWFAGLPAHAQLTVTAPTPEQSRHLETWYTAHIPARFRARTPFTVHELNDADMEAYLKADDSSDADSGGGDVNQSSHSSGEGDSTDDIDGVYEGDPDRIALRLPAAGDPDMFTFAHEYGHYVWFNLMSADDRKRYAAIYNRQRAAHHLVTHYAETDVEEGFAEAFSFFAGEPPMLAHRDPASYDFINHWAGPARS